MASDDDNLFRDIHRFLLSQARQGEKMDTETMLADRFQVSRYRIRRVLDQLSQMGVVDRAQKRGMTLSQVTPDFLARNICAQISVSNFDIHEFLEALTSIENEVVKLSVMRITPVALGQLTTTLNQFESCLEVHEAALKMHTTFHRQLCEACGSRILLSYALASLEHWHSLLEECDTLNAAFFSSALETDRELLDAVQADDVESAQAIIDAQLRDELTYLIKH